MYKNKTGFLLNIYIYVQNRNIYAVLINRWTVFKVSFLIY